MSSFPGGILFLQAGHHCFMDRAELMVDVCERRSQTQVSKVLRSTFMGMFKSVVGLTSVISKSSESAVLLLSSERMGKKGGCLKCSSTCSAAYVTCPDFPLVCACACVCAWFPPFSFLGGYMR